MFTHCLLYCCLQEAKKLFCVDGNFGLVRKKSSGLSFAAPKHLNKHFMDQAVVDAFVDSNLRNGKSANSVQVKKKNFTGLCFHAQLVQVALNLFQAC